MKVRFTPQESPLPGVSCAPSKHFNSDRLQGVGVFKASAVRLVLDEGKTVGAAARDLDLTETAPREWVKRADRTHGRTGLTTAEADSSGVGEREPTSAAWTSSQCFVRSVRSGSR